MMRKTHSLLSLASLLVLALALSGCGTSVKRMDVGESRDLSGAWNDTDSRDTSAAMIKDALSRQWLVDFTRTQRRRPTVIVGEIQNLTHEHINVNTFVGDMERELINSDRVQFVASSTERQEIREERKDMDVHASEATRKAMGKETGADYMLKGKISTIIDTSGSTQIRYYQVDLTLISLTDNRIVWLGQHKIKKQVERGNLKF